MSVRQRKIGATHDGSFCPSVEAWARSGAKVARKYKRCCDTMEKLSKKENLTKRQRATALMCGVALGDVLKDKGELYKLKSLARTWFEEIGKPVPPECK